MMRTKPAPQLLEVAVVRQGVAVIARGPILAVNAERGVAAILGPIEALPGDTVAIIAVGREPSTWILEEAFSLGSGRGTFPQCALIYFPIDTVEPWSIDRSLSKYSSRRLDYEAGASMPTVRVLLA